MVVRGWVKEEDLGEGVWRRRVGVDAFAALDEKGVEESLEGEPVERTSPVLDLVLTMPSKPGL